ncbi:YdeI/OmpD-associated family protein [Gracilimonas sp. BCB1]|uniref:YdeI/OmpD-associated family protein n=1 Tax=Gracilimonas sp. BCB1 TaxID=3152362 RepID=UPI0032D8E9A4
MAKVTSVESYIDKHEKWEKSLSRLHALISKTELEAAIKWGQPVYSINGKNVVGIGAFQEHFGLWFFNGALLDDPNGYLHNAQEGKTKAMRQLRFHSFEDIDATVVNEFLHQAIENQRAGKEVQIDTKRKPDIPPLLAKAFSIDEELKTQFKGLTPGRQREYAQYISEAKQEATKQRRLDKIIPMIKQGMGLNDKYQK